MRRLSYFLLIALAGLARADDTQPLSPPSAPVGAPVVPPAPLELEKPRSEAMGFAPPVDVAKYRCIPGKLYAQDCGQALAMAARNQGRNIERQRVECVLDELLDLKGRQCGK